MITMGIVDDHASIRDSYKQAFESDGRFKVIGSLASASLADLWCQKHRPNILLLDICTEGEESGLDAAKRIEI